MITNSKTLASKLKKLKTLDTIYKSKLDLYKSKPGLYKSKPDLYKPKLDL